MVRMGIGSTARPVRRQLIAPMKLKEAMVISTMSIAAIKPIPNSMRTAFRSLVA